MKKTKIQQIDKLKCFYVWCKNDEELGGVLVHAISASKARYYALTHWIGFDQTEFIDLSVIRQPKLDELPINLENSKTVLSWEQFEDGECPYKNDDEFWREFKCNCEICSKYRQKGIG